MSSNPSVTDFQSALNERMMDALNAVRSSVTPQDLAEARQRIVQALSDYAHLEVGLVAEPIERVNPFVAQRIDAAVSVAIALLDPQAVTKAMLTASAEVIDWEFRKGEKPEVDEISEEAIGRFWRLMKEQAGVR